MIRRPPRSTLFPTRRSSDLPDPPLPAVVPADARVEHVAHRPPELEVEKRRDERLEADEEPRDEQSRPRPERARDRKSTRLNSSHLVMSYAVFSLQIEEGRRD